MTGIDPTAANVIQAILYALATRLGRARAGTAGCS